MNVYRLNPVTDPRWAAFVADDVQSSIFHSAGWIDALHRTYGYEPLAYTTTPPGCKLTDGMAFCRIRTWLTGRRLVSLPFSDHCNPLVNSPEALSALFAAIDRDLEVEGWKYAEFRPLIAPLAPGAKLAETEAFVLHVLDLRPGLSKLFSGFHKGCIQRKIRRAEREGLVCEEGQTERLLRIFYSLLVKTRRRHGLPPQPMQWFRNLVACLGTNVRIRVALKGSVAVAGILTLQHKNTLVYKYGCSDERFNNLGGTQLLLWKAIEEAHTEGLLSFDLGRSELNNPGLLTFKDRWGAARTTLHYYRWALVSSSAVDRDWTMNLAKCFFSRIPDPFLAAAGRLLYRHIG